MNSSQCSSLVEMDSSYEHIRSFSIVTEPGEAKRDQLINYTYEHFGKN